MAKKKLVCDVIGEVYKIVEQIERDRETITRAQKRIDDKTDKISGKLEDIRSLVVHMEDALRERKDLIDELKIDSELLQERLDNAKEDSA